MLEKFLCPHAKEPRPAENRETKRTSAQEPGGWWGGTNSLQQPRGVRLEADSPPEDDRGSWPTH